jgi:hypothetical protein
MNIIVDISSEISPEIKLEFQRRELKNATKSRFLGKSCNRCWEVQVLLKYAVTQQVML